MCTRFVSSTKRFDEDTIVYKLVTKGGYSLWRPSERKEQATLDNRGKRLRYNKGTVKKVPLSVEEGEYGMYCYPSLDIARMWQIWNRESKIVQLLCPKGSKYQLGRTVGMTTVNVEIATVM